MRHVRCSCTREPRTFPVLSCLQGPGRLLGALSQGEDSPSHTRYAALQEVEGPFLGVAPAEGDLPVAPAPAWAAHALPAWPATRASLRALQRCPPGAAGAALCSWIPPPREPTAAPRWAPPLAPPVPGAARGAGGAEPPELSPQRGCDLPPPRARCRGAPPPPAPQGGRCCSRLPSILSGCSGYLPPSSTAFGCFPRFLECFLRFCTVSGCFPRFYTIIGRFPGFYTILGNSAASQAGSPPNPAVPPTKPSSGGL